MLTNLLFSTKIGVFTRRSTCTCSTGKGLAGSLGGGVISVRCGSLGLPDQVIFGGNSGVSRICDTSNDGLHAIQITSKSALAASCYKGIVCRGKIPIQLVASIKCVTLSSADCRCFVGSR